MAKNLDKKIQGPGGTKRPPDKKIQGPGGTKRPTRGK